MVRREAVADLAAEAGYNHAPVTGKGSADHHGKHGFQHVSQKRQRSGKLPEGSCHVGCSGITAALFAYIFPIHQFTANSGKAGRTQHIGYQSAQNDFHGRLRKTTILPKLTGILSRKRGYFNLQFENSAFVRPQDS